VCVCVCVCVYDVQILVQVDKVSVLLKTKILKLAESCW